MQSTKIYSAAVLSALLVALAAATVLIVACGDSNILAPRVFSNVDDAEARWKAHNIKNYTITQRRSCFCVPINYPITIKVDSTGTITSVRDSRGTSINNALGTSIEKMFADIRALQNKANASVQVQYDSVYGYPRQISADPIKMAVDDEYSLETTLVR